MISQSKFPFLISEAALLSIVTGFIILLEKRYDDIILTIMKDIIKTKIITIKKFLI